MRGVSLLQGAPVLNCPGCGTKVADGTSICPSCDYIIDTSFISSDVPEAPDDESGAQAPPPRRPATASRPAVRRTGATGSRPRVPPSGASARPAAPEVPSEDATNIKSMDEILRNAPPRAAGGRPGSGSRPAAASRSGSRPAAAAAPRREVETSSDESAYDNLYDSSSNITGPEEIFRDIREFVGELSLADKVAFVGASLILFSGFFPWKETAEDGEILGLMSLGLVGVLSAAGLLATMAVRVRRLMPDLNVLVPWLGQLGLSIFSVLWCVIFMKLASDTTEVPSPMGNAMIMNSTPSFGVYLALLGALGCLGGTLLGLKEKPTS